MGILEELLEALSISLPVLDLIGIAIPRLLKISMTVMMYLCPFVLATQSLHFRQTRQPLGMDSRELGSVFLEVPCRSFVE